MTAVEFLHSEYKRIFGDVLVKPNQAIEMADALAQVKEMFKQQVIESYENGYSDSDNNFPLNSQYYNETFKSE